MDANTLTNGGSRQGRPPFPAARTTAVALLAGASVVALAVLAFVLSPVYGNGTGQTGVGRVLRVVGSLGIGLIALARARKYGLTREEVISVWGAGCGGGSAVLLLSAAAQGELELTSQLAGVAGLLAALACLVAFRISVWSAAAAFLPGFLAGECLQRLACLAQTCCASFIPLGALTVPAPLAHAAVCAGLLARALRLPRDPGRRRSQLAGVAIVFLAADALLRFGRSDHRAVLLGLSWPQLLDLGLGSLLAPLLRRRGVSAEPSAGTVPTARRGRRHTVGAFLRRMGHEIWSEI